MKRLLFIAVILLAAGDDARAQSTSHTWIDVTTSPYNAKNDCSADAGPAINSAIAGAPAGSGVIFFPTGCYLISTQIVDTNTAALLSYLGEGNVQLQASSTAPPASIIQFGNDSTAVGYRKIENLYFNCNNAVSTDGVDLDGFYNSEFYDVTIANCNGTHLRTVGANTSNFTNKFMGGAIYAGTSYGNGVQVAPSAAFWSFFGTRIIGRAPGGSGATGVGIDFESSGGGLFGGEVSGWTVGIYLQVTGGNGAGGQEISGSSINNNASIGIRAGSAGTAGAQATGFSIKGNFLSCNNGSNAKAVLLDQAKGFDVSSNFITGCPSVSIQGQADSSLAGADGGFVGTNFLDSVSAPVSLLGSKNTVTAALSTKSSNYTLNGADSWINATGSITITIPHAISAQQWKVFNSGSGTVSLVCDSGTINGTSSLSLSSQTGRTAGSDGTNCFAF